MTRWATLKFQRLSGPITSASIIATAERLNHLQFQDHVGHATLPLSFWTDNRSHARCATAAYRVTLVVEYQRWVDVVEVEKAD